MKIKNYGIAFGAILVFFVLVNCVFSQPTQTAEEILKLIPDDWKDTPKELDAMKSLAQQIYDDYVELSGHFTEGGTDRMDKMNKKYAKLSALIVDEKYDAVSAKDCGGKFKDFWGEKRAKGTKVKFTAVSISISDTLGPQEGIVIEEGKAPEFKTFDYVAFVVHEIRIEKAEGESGSGYDPPGIVVYAHQGDCTWKGRG